ncbi:MAG TPA: phosphoribosylaminoimidazolesuccinocarboxamide synthase [Candidatus Methanofastidiosa archaeon]|nr:phosphoribosylaminoimidazolesuccinocarboxamide synthase [Candidatus Methanofastidiosa archaeon]
MSSLRSGSVKEIRQVQDDELEFEFTDRISVFDKIIPSTIPGKGESLCSEGVFWFQRAEELGIGTHFLERTSPNSFRVKRVNIIRDYDSIGPDTTNYLIPLEFICRHYVAGSLYDRIKKGKIDPESLGFDKGHGVSYGEKLPRPYLETSTKLERVDRLLELEEALDISGLSPEEYNNIIDIILKLDAEIEKEVSKRGLIHVDGKKEFAFDKERKVMVIDVFGTADEDRFWDRGSWEDGQCIELSKEFVRKYYEGIGYKARLYDAREKGIEEPEIPPLPEEMIKKASETYKNIQYRITGE